MAAPAGSDKIDMSMLKGFRPLSWLFMGTLFLAALGCARPENSSQSVSIAPPKFEHKVGAQALTLNHVVINISGDGIATPIVFNWDSCSDCPQARPLPSAFVLDVPSGEKRFIQVLAIYKNSDGESMDFHYGDVTKDITNADVLVPVTVASVGGGQILEGKVTGRYYGSISNGEPVFPTGEVLVKFSLDDKPSIIVERESILAGWFSFFMLRGVNLTYEMSDGTQLFGGPVDLSSATLNPDNYPTGSVMKVWFPQHRVVRTEASGMSFKDRPPHIKLYGFFGLPGLTVNKRVCRETTGATDGVLRGGSFTAKLAMSNRSPPNGTDFFSNHSEAYFLGGEAAAGATCGTLAASDLYNRHLKVTQGNIESRDGNAEPFFGPFRQVSATGGALEILAPAGTQTKRIMGQLLPGVRALSNSIVIYKATGVSAQNFNFEKVPCSAIAAGAFYNFVHAGTGLVDNDGKFDVETFITNEDVINGVSAAICPALGSVVWPVGGMIPAEAFGRCRGCEAAQADRIAAQMGSPQFAINQCVPLNLQLYNSLNRAAVNRETVTLTPALSSGGTVTGGFFSNRTCSQSAAQLQFLPNETKKTYYYLATSLTPTTVAATLNISAASTSVTQSQSVLMNISQTEGGSSSDRISFAPANLNFFSPGQCAPVELWSSYQDRLRAWAFVTSVNLSSNPSGAISFHNNCERALTNAGSSSISAGSPASYYFPMALRSESSSAFDIGVKAVAMNGGTPVSTNGIVLRSPLSFEPRMWMRAENFYSEVTNGTVTTWQSRVGSDSVTGCSPGVDCPSTVSESFGTLGALNYLDFTTPTAQLHRGGLQNLGTRSSTTMALVRLDSDSVDGTIFEHMGPAPDYAFFKSFWNSAAQRVVLVHGTVGASAGPISSDQIAVSPGNPRWAFVSVRRTLTAGTSAISLSVNGVEIGSNSTAETRNWDYFYVGGVSGQPYSFQGGIAEVIFVDQALANAEIAKTYQFYKFRYPFLNLP